MSRLAIAGATELLFGLLVISGAFTQVAVLVAMVPFNATLLLFEQTEMVGHLPVYGVFLALLVYGSNAHTAADVRWQPATRRSVRDADVDPAPATALEEAALVQGAPAGRGVVVGDELDLLTGRVEHLEPGPGQGGFGGDVVGRGARMPGAEEVVARADGVRRKP